MASSTFSSISARSSSVTFSGFQLVYNCRNSPLWPRPPSPRFQHVPHRSHFLGFPPVLMPQHPHLQELLRERCPKRHSLVGPFQVKPCRNKNMLHHIQEISPHTQQIVPHKLP